MYTANISAVLSTAFGSVTFPTVIWLYSEQLMGAHSHWLYWFWNTAKKSSLYGISLLLVQTLHSTDYSQWQYIFQLSTAILTDTSLSISVGNFVHFTVLGCTEHSNTTVGNVTLPLTVSNAEFGSKFSRIY